MSGAAVAASSAGDDLPGPSGSSSSDFMGAESRKKPKHQGSDVRMSRIETVHRTLHGLHQEWEQRKRATFEIDYTNPSILCSSSSDAVSCIELGGLGERQLLTVLLPWMQVTVCCGFEFSLNGLKTELFAKLKRMSVAQFSMNATDYVFQVLRKSTGDMEELYNEEMLLSKIDFTRPYPMLSLFEPESFRHERDLAHVIGQALGYSLDELETKLSDELKTCRAALFKDTVEAVNSRGSEGYEHYAFPEAVVLDVAQPCPHSLIAKIKSANLSYQVFFRSLEDEKENIDHGAAKALVNFVPDMTPTSLVAKVVRDLKRSGHIKAEEVDTDYLLQLVGQKSYLTANDKLLITYGEVRSAFENYRNPRFVLRRKAIVLLDYPKPRPIHKPSYVRAEESRMASEDSATSSCGIGNAAGGGSEPTESHITLWDVDEYLSMRPLSCSSMGTSDMDSQISVDFIVYCGKTSLIHKASSKVPSHNPRWLEGMISFDLYMKDLPPAAVLTVHLVETKMRKGKAEDRVLGWVNIRLFDWRGELLQGVVTLNLWGGEPQYPPHGRIGGNDKKQGSSCRLVIELARYRSQHVRMPDTSQFAPFVRFIRSIEEPQKIQTDDFSIDRILTTIRKRLLGGVVSAEEELFVWNQRHYVSEHLPDALLVIAEAEVTWRKREHFTEIYVMLESWGRLTVGTAFRILSKKCMDPIIRRFAVSQLDIMLDNQSFPLFILPFIQALKCEAWSYNPLSCLLLKKALSDYRIGHKLFWLLRAELANLKDADGNISEMYKRFALIIEAYLRGNDEHIRTVVKQVEMVDYLHRLSLLVKGIREKDAATERLREELRNNCPTLEKIDSPLDPSNALGHLRIDKCRVLGSAKMPLLLSWQNRSPLSEHYLPTYEIIFKNGDDLRQDMLVVQMLELMDSIWKRNQLDCCLSTYPVLPMGTKYGMIGVVPNCSTIFEIQSDGGKVGTAVKSLETTFINRYIKNNAGSTRKYMECVDRFLMSCVGYSVGTFIMGIMDRHNDNIMMTHDGKIFHIDFGHILGHGKTKLGIRRDRVPFVLTEHFLCVIGQGRPVSKDSHEVTKFKKLCCDAYMMLWEERDLFLSLFAVMQSMELPELSTEADLDHLKSTLRVAFHDGMMTEARAFFAEIFDEAFNGSWATKTNWFFHAVKHI